MDSKYVDIINYALFGLIILLSLVIVYLIYYFLIRRKNPNETLMEINKKLTESENPYSPVNQNTKSHKRKKENSPPQTKEDAELQPGNTLLEFDSICNDMLIGSSGQSYSMVIQCKGIHYDLMSEDEKTSVEQAFISFLNNLAFPIQIYIQTRILDFGHSFSSYSEKLQLYENELRVLVEKFNSLHLNQKENRSQISQIAKELLKKQKLYEYAKDLQLHIERLSTNNSVFQNNYFIVIECSAEELNINPKSKKDNGLNTAYTEIYRRSNDIIDSLQKCGVEASILNSYQLAEFLYFAFTQDDVNLNKLREAMESGFFRLYSKSG